MLVSVITPTYNRAKTIQRAVNSVLAQTWKELEIIVVDDGSTDRTDEILKAYGNKIRVIRQQNGGASAARNTGIRAATGEIISFLDSDDEWLPEKTERQVKLLQRPELSGVVCCICNARMLRSAGAINSFEVTRLYPGHTEGVWSNPAHILIDRFLLFNQVVAIWRRVLERCGYFRVDLRIMEDYDLSLRIALAGPWAFITDPLVIWHEDAGSGLSRNVNQMEICQRAFQILADLGHSTQFGPILPHGPFQRRCGLLKLKMKALALSSRPSPIHAVAGRLLLFYLKIHETIYRRWPLTSRMSTHEASP
jgi:glycosyltransferase involved in cell wall biosynthesis